MTADLSRCVGAGMCALTAPKVFDQNDDGFVLIVTEHPAGADEESAREAGTLCPSGALRVSG